jgi:hexosaminidase
MAATPELFPQPRELVLTGRAASSATLDVLVETDASLPEEGYALDVDDNVVTMLHRDERALQYARATLAQLQEQHPDGLPGVRIRDWPDFPVRGYMLDVSRDRVPTRDTLARLVGLCATARINHVELYTEHTFAYRDHEVVWRNASPITPDDVQWLDAMCREQGIDLVANQNCFGHMGRWLAHDEYRERAEAPDGIEPLPGFRMPPSVLAPTPENAAFAHALFTELLANFTSRRVNINCDETFDLGFGVSKGRVERDGKERVYCEHLRRIIEPLVDDGRLVHYWADIVRKHPALAREIPDGATPVCWTYEAPSALERGSPIDPSVRTLLDKLGIDVDSFSGFDANTRPLADAGVPFWVAPGTSAWDSLVGRIDNAFGNLLDAARTGRERDARGYLITDWGDNGHLQPPSVSFAPLLYGGAVAWCAATNHDADAAHLLDRYAFDDSSGHLGAAVVELGRQWNRTGLGAMNGSPLQGALVTSALGLSSGGEASVPATLEVVERIEAAIAEVGAARPACRDADIVRAELEQAARLARQGAWRLIAAAGGPAPAPAELRADLAEAIAAQREVWLRRARPGGLDDSVARLEATLARNDA